MRGEGLVRLPFVECAPFLALAVVNEEPQGAFAYAST